MRVQWPPLRVLVRYLHVWRTDDSFDAVCGCGWKSREYKRKATAIERGKEHYEACTKPIESRQLHRAASDALNKAWLEILKDRHPDYHFFSRNEIVFHLEEFKTVEHPANSIA
jgi:hypothetical protein